MEGIGKHGPGSFIVLDRSVVDYYEEVTDQEAFLMARELAKEEGILCGKTFFLSYYRLYLFPKSNDRK